MSEKLKGIIKEIAVAPPGTRFTAFYEKRKTGNKNFIQKKILLIILGSLMFVVGVIIALPPMIPGFWLYIPGLAIIAAEVRFVAVGLDRLELWVRKIIKGMRNKRG